MRRALCWLSVCASILLASGCGDSSKNSASTINEFYAGEYRALCDWAARCGFLGKSEVARCYDQYTVVTDGPVDFASLVAKGAITFDAEAAGRCLDGLDALSCHGFEETPAECQAAARGTVPPGAACIVDQECKDGYCTATKDGCAGTCAMWTAANASCTTSTQCGPDGLCDMSRRVCVARIAAGGACGGAVPCGRGLACVPGGGGAAPTCGPPVGAGAACLDDSSCAAGTYCDAAKKVCTPRGGTGTPCTTASQCRDGLACLGLPLGSGGSGTCGPWLDANGACTPGTVGCPSGMPCDGTKKTCTAPLAPGQACTGRFTCRSDAYCDITTHKCEALVSYGGTCTPQDSGDNPCAIGICEPSGRKCLVLCP